MDGEHKKILNLVLNYLPYYGDFNLIEKLLSIDDSNFHEVYLTITNPQEQALQVSEHLVSNGFAIKRNDLKPDGSSIEFTERGRWLKEQGSMEAYEKYQKDKKEKRRIQGLEILASQERNKQMNRLTLIIAIGTSIAAFYYSLEILNHIFGFYCY